MGKRWTKADDTRLAKMRGAGLAYKHIAVALGRTEGACYNRAYGLGIAKPHAIDEPVMTHEEMYPTKVTLTNAQLQVAKRLELSPEEYARGVILADYEELHNTTQPEPEPTTWIGRIKRLLGVSDIGAQ